MSKKGEIVSAVGQDEQENDSVFDFLYHDSRRIASFLSQFGNDGHLTALKRGEAATKVAKRSKKFGLGGSTPLGGANVDVELGPGESGSESLEREFDPFWANALEFLDVLENRDMIQRDLESARIGQFVLTQGSLIIADMEAYRDVWKSSVVREYMKASALDDDDDEKETGNRQQRRASKAKARSSLEKPSETDLVLELLPYLPHSPQINIITDNYAAWGTVEADHLSGTFADLSLKHGSKIAGQWAALGILDGMPFAADQMISPLEQVRLGMTTDSITKVPLEIGPQVRQLLGRPLLSYGITPLLIFREVA